MRKILEDEAAALVKSLVGRTITRVMWADASPAYDLAEHEFAWLWLDDGRVIEFGSYGYDVWGAIVREIEVTDVAECLHCGKSHLDSEILGLPSNPRFTFCEDGVHRAWEDTSDGNSETAGQTA